MAAETTGLVWDQQYAEAINVWIDSRGGGRCSPGTFTALAWVNQGEISGAIAFYDSNGRNANANIAVEGGRLSPGLLKAGLWYAFGQLRLARLTFLIEDDNIPSISLVTRLGATHEATLREAGKKGNMVIYSLFPADCPIWRKLAERGKIF